MAKKRVAKLHLETVLQLINLEEFHRQQSPPSILSQLAECQKQTASLKLEGHRQQTHTILLMDNEVRQSPSKDTKQILHVVEFRVSSSFQTLVDNTTQVDLGKLSINWQLGKRNTPLDKSSILHLLSPIVCYHLFQICRTLLPRANQPPSPGSRATWRCNNLRVIPGILDLLHTKHCDISHFEATDFATYDILLNICEELQYIHLTAWRKT